VQEIDEKLKRLPPKPSDDMAYEFPNMLRLMAEELDDQVNAAAADKSFYQDIDKIYRVFSDKVKASLPTFKVKETIIGMGIPGPPQGEHSKGLMSLDQVKELRQRSRGRELPTFSPYGAVEELIGMTRGSWEAAMLECLDAVQEELRGAMHKSINKHFGRFPNMLQLLR
jgi:pyruvate dehydrogenase complex dehydrogenase (E1) component